MEEFKSGRTSRRHSAALLGQGLNVGQDVLESQRDAEPRLLRNILLISSAKVGSSLGPSCMWPAVEPQGASSPSQGSQAGGGSSAGSSKDFCFNSGTRYPHAFRSQAIRKPTSSKKQMLPPVCLGHQLQPSLHQHLLASLYVVSLHFPYILQFCCSDHSDATAGEGPSSCAVSPMCPSCALQKGPEHHPAELLPPAVVQGWWTLGLKEQIKVTASTWRGGLKHINAELHRIYFFRLYICDIALKRLIF